MARRWQLSSIPRAGGAELAISYCRAITFIHPNLKYQICISHIIMADRTTIVHEYSHHNSSIVLRPPLSFMSRIGGTGNRPNAVRVHNAVIAQTAVALQPLIVDGVEQYILSMELRLW